MCLRINLLQFIQPYYLLLLFLIFNTQVATQQEETYHCESIELTRIEDFEKIQNCSVIVGYVRIININFKETPDAKLVKTDIKEITDYLFVYRVNGVESLQRFFPNLLLIRGSNLLFDEYAFVVFENRKLWNLGLAELKRIEKGSIRVEGNPELCYASTVNWIQLLGNSSLQHFSIKNNRPPNYCPTCPRGKSKDNTDEGFKQYCWSKDAIQKPMLIASNDHQCVNSCLDESSTCSSQSCTLCANLNQNGKCVENCGALYFEHNKRECLSAANCTKLGKVPVIRSGLCLDKSKTQNYDSMYCDGVYKIRTTEDLQQLKGCVKIRGSLVLQLTEKKSNIIGALEQIFLNLKEITGYLQIENSPQIVSLNFLGNLDTIGGNELYANLYALYIVDNYHLEEIWRKNQKVAILKGQIFFHLNPRLCYEKILALQPHIRSGENITIMNVSPNSNGERVVCGSAVRKMNAVVEDVNATVVLITVDSMPADDLELLLGYQYYYKIAPIKNVTMYEGRHGCGHDEWRLDISVSKNRRHLINNLKPYTQYAYFVRTITRVDYHKQLEAYSDINYFRTLPRKPGPVAKIYYHSLSASKIAVHWWPPRIPNGIIDKYIINFSRYEFPKGNISEILEKSYTPVPKTCQCDNVIVNTNSIPPNDEDYYNKEEMIYEEALPNILFTPRPIDVTKNTAIEDTAVTKKNPVNTQSSTQAPANQNHSTGEELDILKKQMEILENFRRKHEEQAREIQEADIETFHIVKPKPACTATNETNDSCIKLESFTGVSVSGHKHSYVIENLEGQFTYRITVRACVKDLPNGCGIESAIFAETVSKRLETFFKSLNYYN